MNEFIEVPTDASEFYKSEHKYRLVPYVRLLADFYCLWGKAVLQLDWDAYRELTTSPKFPNEWLDIVPPSAYFRDESLIPSEFIMSPVTGETDPALQKILAPDAYGIAAWLAHESEKG